MAAQTFAAPVPGPVGFDLDASVASVEITVSPAATVASAELSGPAEVVNGTRATASDTRWALTLPRTTYPATGGTVVVQTTGHQVFRGTLGGPVVMTGGRVIVNGVDVTAAASGPAPEPVHLAVTLPAGSRLAARLDAGTLTTRGELPAAEVTATSADADIDTAGSLAVRTVSGDITARSVIWVAKLRSVSGDIDVDAAGGPVSADTTSGDITVHATAAVTIDTATVSGDIRVTAAPGISPDVRARSVSGRVRTAGGPR
jgi:hypothetical protein